eukprot:653770-Pelagomonas_calceolata.AAC.1
MLALSNTRHRQTVGGWKGVEGHHARRFTMQGTLLSHARQTPTWGGLGGAEGQSLQRSAPYLSQGLHQRAESCLHPAAAAAAAAGAAADVEL